MRFASKPLDGVLATLFLDAATKNNDGRGCLLVNAVGELHAPRGSRIALPTHRPPGSLRLTARPDRPSSRRTR